MNFNEAVSYGKTVGFQLSTEFEIGEIFRAGETHLLLKVQVPQAIPFSFIAAQDKL